MDSWNMLLWQFLHLDAQTSSNVYTWAQNMFCITLKHISIINISNVNLPAGKCTGQ